jgi:hypothetical protein
MKFEIMFDTTEQDGDDAVSVLQSVLLSAQYMTITKSDNGGCVSINIRPTEADLVIDAEIIPEKVVEKPILVGSNIDTII